MVDEIRRDEGVWIEKNIVKKLTDYLKEQNISYQIKHHSKTVFTSEEAAKERGVRLSQIVKTMFLSGEEGKIIVAVLPGDRRLDRKKIKKVSGYPDLRLMEKETIEKQTGFTVGAISPVGNKLKDLPMFVDPSVFDEELLDISSGDPNAGIELTRDDLKRLLKHATVADITEKNLLESRINSSS
jgi:Cys-tRNA(Pro) deacylase